MRSAAAVAITIVSIVSLSASVMRVIVIVARIIALAIIMVPKSTSVLIPYLNPQPAQLPVLALRVLKVLSGMLRK